MENKNYFTVPRGYGRTQTLIEHMFDEYAANGKPFTFVSGKDIYGLTDMYPVEPRYLDASVCAETFYRIADEWWHNYEIFAHKITKNFCLKEYHKWTKYAKIFERSC